MTRVAAYLALAVLGLTAGSPLCAAAPKEAAAPKVNDKAKAAALHDEIDRLFAADSLVPPSPPADDAEFLRRVMLDLHGIIPSASEVREFLADKSPAKRTTLVDRLLASPRFARHMANQFDVLLLERKTENNVKSQEWYDYLYQSFLEGKPYDRLVREILAADENDESAKPATKFYFVRTCEPHTVTRDVGRLFFGADMQCNQCHDNPLVDDYKISDYYGLYAFVNRTFVYQDKKKVQSIGEKPEGEANFKSVFTGESADKVAPQLPRGPKVVEPVYKKGEEYVVKPAKDVKPIPKYSRRAVLAEQAAAGASELFDRNIANRLWAQMFGRGLVHPVDFHHPDNPPSHPEILDLLTREFRKHGSDVRYLLRELALSQTYGRTCEVPSAKSLDAKRAAARATACERELADLEKRLGATKDEAETRRLKTLVNARRKSVEEALIVVDYVKLAASDPKEATLKWNALVAFWNERGDVPLLKPLSPEAFAFSLMQATGAVDGAVVAARSTFEKKKPKEWTDADPTKRPQIEAMTVDKQTFAPLQTNLRDFIAMYGDAPGSDFAATVNQALFFGNAGKVDGWIKTATSFVDRAAKETDPARTAEEIYLNTLSRLPTKAEIAAVTGYLKDRQDRPQAIQEMAWGLLSSNEFRFNH